MIFDPMILSLALHIQTFFLKITFLTASTMSNCGESLVVTWLLTHSPSLAPTEIHTDTSLFGQTELKALGNRQNYQEFVLSSGGMVQHYATLWAN